jgi:hypothetical protein
VASSHKDNLKQISNNLKQINLPVSNSSGTCYFSPQAVKDRRQLHFKTEEKKHPTPKHHKNLQNIRHVGTLKELGLHVSIWFVCLVTGALASFHSFTCSTKVIGVQCIPCAGKRKTAVLGRDPRNFGCCALPAELSFPASGKAQQTRNFLSVRCCLLFL